MSLINTSLRLGSVVVGSVVVGSVKSTSGSTYITGTTSANATKLFDMTSGKAGLLSVKWSNGQSLSYIEWTSNMTTACAYELCLNYPVNGTYIKIVADNNSPNIPFIKAFYNNNSQAYTIYWSVTYLNN